MSMAARAHAGRLGKTVVISGRIVGEGDLLVEGRFDGEIQIRGTLAVGPDGAVHAPVTATSVVVGGYLRGNVAATEVVSVHSGGRIDGDVKARRIGIDDGAVLSGGIEMDFEIPGSVEDEKQRSS